MNGDIVLTSPQCTKAEQLCNDLVWGGTTYISGYISRFEATIKNAQIAAWASSTEAGLNFLNKVKTTITALTTLNQALESIHSSTVNLISQSKELNKKQL